jgi:hypothetical protein
MRSSFGLYHALEINLHVDHVSSAQPSSPAAFGYAFRTSVGGTNLLPAWHDRRGISAPKLADEPRRIPDGHHSRLLLGLDRRKATVGHILTVGTIVGESGPSKHRPWIIDDLFASEAETTGPVLHRGRCGHAFLVRVRLTA